MASRDRGWYEASCPATATATAAATAIAIDGDRAVPDPASRFQPRDVHGPSEVVDPRAYRVAARRWLGGRPWHETVLYELHVGTFTAAGTFDGGRRQSSIASPTLGVTAIELMPVAEFPGARNWGYDGVLPFAPDAAYGRPDDLKRLIDAAHRARPHGVPRRRLQSFRPGRELPRLYAPHVLHRSLHTPWGAAIEFRRRRCRPVRDFFIHNALYWLEEFNCRRAAARRRPRDP